MALGEVIGAGLGLGASFLGVPPSIGVPAGQALGGFVEGQIKESQAKKMEVPTYNPIQQSFLDELMKRRRNLEMGLAYQNIQRDINNSGQSAMNTLANYSGGNVGATIQGLSTINRGTSRNLGKLAGEMSLEGMRMDSLIANVIQNMANRERSIATTNKYGAEMQGVQQTKAGMQNLMGLDYEAIAKLLQGNKTGTTTPSTD
jgi:hypothetical protein